MMSAAATCLAIAMFLEARGEPALGMQYVGHIVKNLSEDKGMTPCEIITNKAGNKDFEFSIGVKSLKTINKRIEKIVKGSRVENDAWQRALDTGLKINARKKDITGGAKFFNVKRKGVRYKTNVRPKTIGNHVYY